MASLIDCVWVCQLSHSVHWSSKPSRLTFSPVPNVELKLFSSVQRVFRHTLFLTRKPNALQAFSSNDLLLKNHRSSKLLYGPNFSESTDCRLVINYVMLNALVFLLLSQISMTIEQVWEGRTNLDYTSSLLFIIEDIQYRNGNQPVTWRQELMQR